MTYAELLEEIAETAYRYTRDKMHEDRLRLAELTVEWRRRRDAGETIESETDEVDG